MYLIFALLIVELENGIQYPSVIMQMKLEN